LIGQTLAIFLDAYRDLNARKLFWITLGLSALVVIVFALFGVDETGLKVVALHLDMPGPLTPRDWYNGIFQLLIISIWLTWAATILALISTAGIFPEFISGGSIDLFLAKPIGRARLFITKYLAGLLFVAFQVIIVAVLSFLVLGVRGHKWEPRLFLAIPIVVCFFSYLYAICVLVGIQTRSTMAALLITGLCWGMFAVMGYGEPMLMLFRNKNEWQAKQERSNADFAEASLRRAQNDPNAAAMLPVLRETADSHRREAEAAEHAAKWWGLVARSIYVVKWVTPKTTDTIGFLETSLFPHKGADSADDADMPTPDADTPGRSDAATMAGGRRMAKELNARSPAWIIGTSLGFEAVVAGAAMCIFCRRDY
jgi:hypothetical protein